MKMVLAVVGSITLFGCGASAPPAADVPPATSETSSAAHDEGEAHAPPGAGTSDKCDDLAHACHEHAAFSALTNECHKIGHGGDAAKCDARHDECMAECEKASKSGAHAHPGGADH